MEAAQENLRQAAYALEFVVLGATTTRKPPLAMMLTDQFCDVREGLVDVADPPDALRVTDDGAAYVSRAQRVTSRTVPSCMIHSRRSGDEACSTSMPILNVKKLWRTGNVRVECP